jgi:hypothetical protein
LTAQNVKCKPAYEHMVSIEYKNTDDPRERIDRS